MNTTTQQADRLTRSLGLRLKPIAIAFCDAVPDGIPKFDRAVPAGCVFWQEAATRTFYTSAEDHAMCAIGVHTHNLAGAPSSQPGELRATLEAMMELDYVRESEVSGIAVMQQSTKHVVYGPLGNFPAEPDVVCLFVDARQGLVLSEATQRTDGEFSPAMGRPACAAIPQAFNRRRAAQSLGCCGARAYVDDLSDDVALWTFPGSKLDEYCDQVEVLAHANETLTLFHERRKSDIESGERPSVARSLHRLTR